MVFLSLSGCYAVLIILKYVFFCNKMPYYQIKLLTLHKISFIYTILTDKYGTTHNISNTKGTA